jgi:type III pantothenate kinase
MFGYAGLVEGIVARFKRELGGSARVIGTGGWAKTIARETDAIDLVDPNLTLHGLRYIYEMNARETGVGGRESGVGSRESGGGGAP